MLERVASAAAENEAAPAVAEGTPAPQWFRGSPLAPGSGLGQAYLIGPSGTLAEVAVTATADPAVERERLDQAMEAARGEITRLSRRISHLVGEDHSAILQAQLMILQDSTVDRDLNSCLYGGASAETALARTLEKYVAAFQRLTNPFFQERIFDIKDVFRRILWHLRPQAAAWTPAAEQIVLVAHEASVLDLFSVDLDHLVGVVLEHGGPHSHAVIIARSLGIPVIGQVAGLFEQLRPGQLLRLDGGTGEIELDPLIADHDTAMEAELAGHGEGPDHLRIESLQPHPSPGANGRAHGAGGERPGMPRIDANVNLLSEASAVIASGASGVGLYRSEMLFLARRTLPTEEEQVEVYRKLVDTLEGRPVTIRSFDLRPDKLAHGSTAASSMAQTLDWRLVLQSPLLQRLFKEQVRAILRAAAAGPVRLLIPLVTRSTLLEFAISTVEQARQELLREDLAFGRDVPLGVMIEVAAVAPLIDAWSSRVDFFSLGTNDMIASALGINRDDPVGPLGDDLLHPGLIRMIGEMIASARRAGRPFSVCGEMAADPEGAVVLVALGASSLSVAVDRVAPIRKLMSRLDPGSLTALGARLSSARSVAEVKKMVTAVMPATESRECMVQAPV